MESTALKALSVLCTHLPTILSESQLLPTSPASHAQVYSTTVSKQYEFHYSPSALNHKIIFHRFLREVSYSKDALSIKNQIGFGQFKFLKSLRRHNCEAALMEIFYHWPPAKENPLVLPVCLYGCLQAKMSIYCEKEFIDLARFQCSTMQNQCTLLIFTIIVAKSSEERVRAAERIVSSGDDPNGLANSSGINELKCLQNEVKELIEVFTEISPLALAIALMDDTLIQTLIKLNANPCLVCRYLNLF